MKIDSSRQVTKVTEDSQELTPGLKNIQIENKSHCEKLASPAKNTTFKK